MGGEEKPGGPEEQRLVAGQKAGEGAEEVKQALDSDFPDGHQKAGGFPGPGLICRSLGQSWETPDPLQHGL